MKKNIYLIIILSCLFVVSVFAQTNNLNKFSYQKADEVSISDVSSSTFVNGNNVTNTIRNNKWELKLTSTTNYSNPYKDVILSVHYSNENSTKTYDSHGFWDGNSTFIIRSYFPTVGEWTWETTCSDTNNTGLHNKSGSVFVSEYNGLNKIYKHGALKVSSNNKYLTHDDDTPFQWMGCTAWGLPKEATYQEWKTYIDDRHSKKFNIIQIAPARIHGGIWLDTVVYPTNQNGDKCFFSDDKWNPLYWQEFDRFVEYANSKEMIIVVVGIAEPVYDILSVEDAKLFARNFGARMEGYQVVLSPAFDTWQTSQRSVLDSTGVYLTNSRHLISQHAGHAYAGGPYNGFTQYFLDKNYLDFSMNQSGHNGGDLDVVYKKAREWNIGLRNELPKKPVINTEAHYSSGKYSDQISYKGYGGSDESARACGWLSWLSGSAGYTYGAMGIWNYGELTNDEVLIPLDSAVNFVSSGQMKYMVEFFNSISWWELEPIHSAIISDEWEETKKMALAISENGKFGAAFLPNNSSIKIDMKEFSNNVNAFWFNTFTGGYTKAEQNVSNFGTHTFTPSAPGEWALLLNSADSIDVLWTQNISISNGSNNQISVSFGKAIGATDSIDVIKGEEKLLPPPTTGTFDARFILENNSTTLLDLRSNNESEITWMIKFQPSGTGYPINFNWDKDKLPLGSFFLRDTISGAIVNIDMKLEDSLILSNQSVTKLQIVYSEKFTTKIKYDKNWNLMSIPLSIENNNITSIFSDPNTSAIRYNRNYSNAEKLNNGIGYWVKHPEKGSVDVFGNQPSTPINVKVGWNLIGAYAEDISTAQIETNPAGIILGNIYGFENTYYIADTLKAGNGYWVKANSVGEINFAKYSNINEESQLDPFLAFNIIATDGKSDSISLTFGLDSLATNGFDTNLGEAELPPAPPAGLFDIRIKMQDTLLASYSDIRYSSLNCYEHIIKYQLGDSSTGLKLDWDLPKGITLNIKDILGGSLFNQNFTSGKNSYLISNTSITSMKLTFCYSDVVLSQEENNTLPEQYSLLQNYPNPFNPSTKIRFGLPNESKVSLVVYNVLGEQIIRLVDKQLKAGFHEVEFNNQMQSSGIYFYRLQAGKYVETKKMILLK
ncbi:MAG: DUF4038 domain-containing protein [Melioribacteraceae bacterium]